MYCGDSNKMEMSVLHLNCLNINCRHNADVSTRIDGSNDGTTGATAMELSADTSDTEKEIQRYINLYLNILN